MREELERKIQEEFPFMRRDVSTEIDLGTREARSEARKLYTPYEIHGCEINDGWYEILREMLLEVEKVYEDNSLPVDIVPYQARHKIGRLQFSYANEPCTSIRG